MVAVVGGLLLWYGQIAAEASGLTFLALVDLALGIAAIFALRWRRRWPVQIALAVTLVSAFSTMSGMAALIAFVSLCTTRRWRAILPVAALGVATGMAFERVRPTPEAPLPWWALLVFNVLLTAVLVAIGLYVGARRELHRIREETAEREEVERVELARHTERARIAREMHDVLAHRISLVSLHAGAMTYRTDLSPEELRAAARVVQENAHRALTDLRSVLGVLRDASVPAEAGSTAPPQPTLVGLPDLVREARAAGTPVELRQMVPNLAAVPHTVGRTAYRIIQEALTNARKHAPGAPVTLEVAGIPGQRLAVEVRNPLPLVLVGADAPSQGASAAATEVPGAGVGLIGLAERAALAGGALEYGPTPVSEYRVGAWLPWAP